MLLRRHVGRRASTRALPLARNGQPKIGQSNTPRAIDHHVGGLDVAVEQPTAMDRAQSGTQLERDLQRLGLGQPSDPPQERSQVLARDVLHRQKVQTPVSLGSMHRHVVDSADAGVRDLARHPHFGEEQGELVLVVRHLLGQELQRHRFAQLEVLGPIDLTHTPTTEGADDSVALGEQGARRKAHPSTAPFRFWLVPGLLCRGDRRRPLGFGGRQETRATARAECGSVDTEGGAVWTDHPTPPRNSQPSEGRISTFGRLGSGQRRAAL